MGRDPDYEAEANLAPERLSRGFSRDVVDNIDEHMGRDPDYEAAVITQVERARERLSNLIALSKGIKQWCQVMETVVNFCNNLDIDSIKRFQSIIMSDHNQINLPQVYTQLKIQNQNLVKGINLTECENIQILIRLHGNQNNYSVFQENLLGIFNTKLTKRIELKEKFEDNYLIHVSLSINNIIRHYNIIDKDHGPLARLVDALDNIDTFIALRNELQASHTNFSVQEFTNEVAESADKFINRYNDRQRPENQYLSDIKERFRVTHDVRLNIQAFKDSVSQFVECFNQSSVTGQELEKFLKFIKADPTVEKFIAAQSAFKNNVVNNPTILSTGAAAEIDTWVLQQNIECQQSLEALLQTLKNQFHDIRIWKSCLTSVQKYFSNIDFIERNNNNQNTNNTDKEKLRYWQTLLVRLTEYSETQIKRLCPEINDRIKQLQELEKYVCNYRTNQKAQVEYMHNHQTKKAQVEYMRNYQTNQSNHAEHMDRYHVKQNIHEEVINYSIDEKEYGTCVIFGPILHTSDIMKLYQKHNTEQNTFDTVAILAYYLYFNQSLDFTDKSVIIISYKMLLLNGGHYKVIAKGGETTEVPRQAGQIKGTINGALGASGIAGKSGENIYIVTSNIESHNGATLTLDVSGGKGGNGGRGGDGLINEGPGINADKIKDGDDYRDLDRVPYSNQSHRVDLTSDTIISTSTSYAIDQAWQNFKNIAEQVSGDSWSGAGFILKYVFSTSIGLMYAGKGILAFVTDKGFFQGIIDYITNETPSMMGSVLKYITQNITPKHLNQTSLDSEEKALKLYNDIGSEFRRDEERKELLNNLTTLIAKVPGSLTWDNNTSKKEHSGTQSFVNGMCNVGNWLLWCITLSYHAEVEYFKKGKTRPGGNAASGGPKGLGGERGRANIIAYGLNDALIVPHINRSHGALGEKNGENGKPGAGTLRGAQYRRRYETKGWKDDGRYVDVTDKSRERGENGKVVREPRAAQSPRGDAVYNNLPQQAQKIINKINKKALFRDNTYMKAVWDQWIDLAQFTQYLGDNLKDLGDGEGLYYKNLTNTNFVDMVLDGDSIYYGDYKNLPTGQDR